MTMFKRCIVWVLPMLIALTSGTAYAASRVKERVSTVPIPKEYLAVFEPCAKEHNIDVLFMAAVFSAGEHHGSWPDINRSWKTSGPGAQGPWQFMPGTWKGWKKYSGVPNPDVQNIAHASCAAAAYLASAGARGVYGNSPKAIRQYRKAAKTYNAGPSVSVERAETFWETRPYMASVVRSYEVFYRYYKGDQPKVANGKSEAGLYRDPMMNVSVPMPEHAEQAEKKQSYDSVILLLLLGGMFYWVVFGGKSKQPRRKSK